MSFFDGFIIGLLVGEALMGGLCIWWTRPRRMQQSILDPNWRGPDYADREKIVDQCRRLQSEGKPIPDELLQQVIILFPKLISPPQGGTGVVRAKE